MQELDYNPSKKDLTDARIHHLLAEELKPYRRVSFIFSILFDLIFDFFSQILFKQIDISNSKHFPHLDFSLHMTQNNTHTILKHTHNQD